MRNARRALFLLPLPAVCTLAAAGELRGRVMDLGATEDGLSGLGGVSIRIKDKASNPIAVGTTDSVGAYRIALPNDLSTKVWVTYSKALYYSNPEVKEVDPSLKKSVDVYLSKGSATGEYYQRVARNSDILSRKDPESTKDIASSIAALPPSDRDQVTKSFGTDTSKDLADQISSAERANLLTASLLAKFKASGDSGYSNVKLHSNFPKTGSVLIYGSVPDAEKLKFTEEWVKSMKGSTIVNNQIQVAK